MDGANDRIVVISDTHLGRTRGGARSAEALRPLWQKASTLIVNGDLAEVHDARLRAAAAREVVALQAMCDEDGVQLILIAGNHDPFITDRRYLSLFDGEVFITHGDVLHPAISPWTRHAAHLRGLHEEAIQIADAVGTAGVAPIDDMRHEAARYASHFEWDAMAEHMDVEPTHRVKKMMQLARQVALASYYWTLLPRSAARYARFHAPACRFFVFGHIHKAGIWNDGDRLVINTGSYGQPGRPRGVIIERGNLTVWPIVEADGRWRWGGGAYAVFPIYNTGRRAVPKHAAA